MALCSHKSRCSFPGKKKLKENEIKGTEIVSSKGLALEFPSAAKQ